MKKSLTAMAVLSASGTAMAQFTGTLYGLVDVSVDNVKTGSTTQVKIDSSILNTSRFS